MKTLAIDIETYSPEDLKKTGVYRYAESPDFEILLFAYAFDNEPVRAIGLGEGEALPEEVRRALTDPAVLKTAFNANFEITCISSYLGTLLPVNQWECTMIRAAMCGLPLSLDAASKALGLTEEKMQAGKALINYFSKPCKPTKANGGRTRNRPHHDPDKWALFKKYCVQDVEVERAIRKELDFLVIPPAEKKLWALDQEISRRGVMVDLRLIDNAIRMDAICKERLTNQSAEITGLENPNSTAQLRDWLSDEMGEKIENISKETIKELIGKVDNDLIRRVLINRQEAAKTSVKKYSAMRTAVCRDGRVRGMLQFYGANRTGRWAGRLVQLHNLPQNHLNDLDLARDTVLSGDIELLQLLFGNVPDTLSQLIRTAFVAPEGHRFIVADFSAIEARVIAWLAGEEWRLEVFRTHGKIYEASASQMFKVPIEQITKGSPLRQKGKVSELALGYQGGPGALVQMGALKMGLTEEELPGLVEAWRRANPAIVRLWGEVGNAAIRAVRDGGGYIIRGGIKFIKRGAYLCIDLPSGRTMYYARPRLAANRFGSQALKYEGMDQTTKRWAEQDTYGGKLVENIVQAIARDCLAITMRRLEKAGYPIAMHVHDEVILEVQNGAGSLSEACDIMGHPIRWAPGLPLRADGYETNYYKKD